jgi:hypothetical protein
MEMNQLADIKFTSLEMTDITHITHIKNEIEKMDKKMIFSYMIHNKDHTNYEKIMNCLNEMGYDNEYFFIKSCIENDIETAKQILDRDPDIIKNLIAKRNDFYHYILYHERINNDNNNNNNNNNEMSKIEKEVYENKKKYNKSNRLSVLKWVVDNDPNFHSNVDKTILCSILNYCVFYTKEIKLEDVRWLIDKLLEKYNINEIIEISTTKELRRYCGYVDETIIRKCIDRENIKLLELILSYHPDKEYFDVNDEFERIIDHTERVEIGGWLEILQWLCSLSDFNKDYLKDEYGYNYGRYNKEFCIELLPLMDKDMLLELLWDYDLDPSDYEDFSKKGLIQLNTRFLNILKEKD